MGIDPKALPDHFLKRMSAEDRKELGQLTQAEAEVIYAAREEKQMHEAFSSWLRSRKIEFIHSRMDKKPTIEEGWPDYTILAPNSPAFCGDFKVPGVPLNDDQKRVFPRIQRAGTTVYIWHSVADAIDATIRELRLRHPGMTVHDQ